MNLVEVLIGAREKLGDGWCQGSSSDLAGKVCAQIAIIKEIIPDTTKPYSQDDLELYYEGLWAIRRQIPSGFKSIPEYNDDPNTSLEDIVMLFDKAIAELGGLV